MTRGEIERWNGNAQATNGDIMQVLTAHALALHDTIDRLNRALDQRDESLEQWRTDYKSLHDKLDEAEGVIAKMTGAAARKDFEAVIDYSVNWTSEQEKP